MCEKSAMETKWACSWFSPGGLVCEVGGQGHCWDGIVSKQTLKKEALLTEQIKKEDEHISAGGNNMSKEIMGNKHMVCPRSPRGQRAYTWPSILLTTPQALTFINSFGPGSMSCSGQLQPWLPTAYVCRGRRTSKQWHTTAWLVLRRKQVPRESVHTEEELLGEAGEAGWPGWDRSTYAMTMNLKSILGT